MSIQHNIYQTIDHTVWDIVFSSIESPILSQGYVGDNVMNSVWNSVMGRSEDSVRVSVVKKLKDGTTR